MAAAVACMSHVVISEVGFVVSEEGWVGFEVDIKPAVQHQPPHSQIQITPNTFL